MNTTETDWTSYIKKCLEIFAAVENQKHITDDQLVELLELLNAAISAIEYQQAAREHAYTEAQSTPADRDGKTKI